MCFIVVQGLVFKLTTMSDLTYFTLQILRCNYRRKEIIKGKEKTTCEIMEKE